MPRRRWFTCLLFLCALPALAASSPRSLVHLRCDSLDRPLGIDDTKPQLSWQIDDPQQGAKQTAYELQIASSPARLAQNNPDVWDSGRVASSQSVGVAYGGPPLHAEQRYYWRVRAWDKDGRAYPVSAASWWETGLMNASAWQGKWIGYEQEELRRIRESGAQWITNQGDKQGTSDDSSKHAFRYTFQVEKPIKFAHLYTTGDGHAAAWVNGENVLAPQPLPPWGRFAWRKYSEADATANLKQGANLLAIEVTHYGHDAEAPMSTCLYIELVDGSVQVVTSSPGWKAALDAPGRWQQPGFDDALWKPAVRFASSDPEQNTDLVRPWPTGPVDILRRHFSETSPVRSARLYATALGSYKFWINGKVIGDEILAPGWTDFRSHVAYQTYDVTSSIRRGGNAIAAYLAPGWYTTPLMWLQQPYQYGNTPPALKAQLRIEHTDGSVEWLVTDPSWKADVSPILQAEIYDGETYDARREQVGWSTSSFDDSKWKSVALVEPVEPVVVAQEYQPIRIEKEVAAKAITNPRPGVYIVDFGQNLAGVTRLHVRAAKGTDVRLRFAELLNPDGTLYTDNLRSAKATDHYIFANNGMASYQPLFTFHGFRYVEITGLTTKPASNALTAEVFHTDAPFTVELKTGSPMINQLWSNILWGQRSNFVGVPTDCPQRDERLGWTGDAQVFWRAASYDMDLTQFSKKFAADLRGTQSVAGMYGIFAPGTFMAHPGFAAGWSDAGIIIPWTSWTQSGDRRIVEQNWSAMQKYLATIEDESPRYIWEQSGIAFGDWLSPEGTTQQTLLATAYWAYDVSLIQQMAHTLGRSEDERKYTALHEKIKAAFDAEFVHADGFVSGGKPDSSLKDTQTGYVLALAMDLVPDDKRAAVAQHLVGKLEANGWRLGTGFLGTPYLLAALSDTSHTDVAYRLLLNTEYPGWGYLVDHGATTMWERWNGDKKIGDPSMNSYNHYAYGAVADWIYRYAAGIDFTPLDAGFQTIYLHPNFDKRLGSLNFTYQSAYGAIRSSWKMSGDAFSWKLTIPPNSAGRLAVQQAHDWILNGAPIAAAKTIPEANGDYILPAGTYAFNGRIQ